MLLNEFLNIIIDKINFLLKIENKQIIFIFYNQYKDYLKNL
jgi:hypothetical protein